MAEQKKKMIKEITRDKDGRFIVPAEGYKIEKIETRDDKIKRRIAELEKELAGMKEPTTEELIAEGRLVHPYYFMAQELEYLSDELKKLK